MHFLAPALGVLASLSQLASAAPIAPADFVLTPVLFKIKVPEAQAVAADFVKVLPGLESTIQNEGSIAGMAKDGETFLEQYTGEVNGDIVAFENFVAWLKVSA